MFQHHHTTHPTHTPKPSATYHKDQWKPGTYAVVIPILFLEHGRMDEQQTRELLGKLIAAAWPGKYPSRRQFAINSGVNIKTLMTAETGAREMSLGTQMRVEKALGWRTGSIGDVLRNRATLTPDSLTIADMERGAPTEEIVTFQESTSHWGSGVTDEELLVEVSYRLRNYKDEIKRLKALPTNEACRDYGHACIYDNLGTPSE